MIRNISRLIVLALLFCSFSFFAQKKGFYENVQKKNVSKVLDDLNTFASAADFTSYFNLYASESIFIGTDAGEVWNKKEFMDYAKPHFDQGKAWSFKSLQRTITFSSDGKYAWFDELLDTQMKICRGSGVLEKIGSQWKIRQYVLSMTIPNDISKKVIEIKAPLEDEVLIKLRNK